MDEELEFNQLKLPLHLCAYDTLSIYIQGELWHYNSPITQTIDTKEEVVHLVTTNGFKQPIKEVNNG